MKKKILLINRTAALEEYAEELSSVKWFALDTEFMREKTYKPELCLLQICTGDKVACIDPLTIPSIEPLLDVIFNPDITKVLHAASQDLEIFYWMRGSVPVNLFDTQIAAPLLGHKSQIGYGGLVAETLGVELSKSHARADWTRRPLPQAQLEYAADDVIYLAQVYEEMTRKLTEMGRLEWLDAEWENLTDKNLYEKPAQDAWRRLRGIDKLRGSRLSAAQKLAAWREITASKRNMPRAWLIKDDCLLDIAKQSPKKLDDLKHIRGLNDSVIRHHADEIIECVHKTQNVEPEKLNTKKRKRPNHEQDALVDVLQAIVKLKAYEVEINPSVLAPKRSLEDLVMGTEDTEILQGWRGALIGKELQALLEGNCDLSIIDKKLVLKS